MVTRAGVSPQRPLKPGETQCEETRWTRLARHRPLTSAKSTYPQALAGARLMHHAGQLATHWLDQAATGSPSRQWGCPSSACGRSVSAHGRDFGGEQTANNSRLSAALTLSHTFARPCLESPEPRLKDQIKAVPRTGKQAAGRAALGQREVRGNLLEPRPLCRRNALASCPTRSGEAR